MEGRSLKTTASNVDQGSRSWDTAGVQTIFLDHKSLSRLTLGEGAFTIRPSLKSQSVIIVRNATCLSPAPTHSKKSENRWIKNNVYGRVDCSKMYMLVLPVLESPKLTLTIRTYTTSTAFFEALWDVRGLSISRLCGHEHSRDPSADFE